jgi:hypothetical protein
MGIIQVFIFSRPGISAHAIRPVSSMPFSNGLSSLFIKLLINNHIDLKS